MKRDVTMTRHIGLTELVNILCLWVLVVIEIVDRRKLCISNKRIANTFSYIFVYYIIDKYGSGLWNRTW